MKTIYPATLLCDFYKTSHRRQYPKGTQFVNSGLIPRSNRYYPEADGAVVAGIQPFVLKYLVNYFNEHFFNLPLHEVVYEYQHYMYFSLVNPGNIAGVSEDDLGHEIGEVDASHIADLHDLGYLPIRLRALPEGTLVPLRVPVLTIENTDERFFWLTNYLETLLSNEVWLPATSATTSRLYRKILNEYAMKTTGSTAGVEFQGHDFSMRGMQTFESSVASGAAHLFSFVGTDTIPAIRYLEEYYGADVTKELVGTSIDATEHSVMCAYGDENEFELFKHLITNVYPSGFFSVVSDTWDFWKAVTEYLPALKDEIMGRDGRVVIRPDSGDPVDIVCGTDKHIHQLNKGIVEFDDSSFDEVDDQRLKQWGIDNAEVLISLIKEKGRYFELQEQLYSVELLFTHKTLLLKAIALQDASSGQFEFQTVLVIGKDYEQTPEEKGLIECLWDTFGGTVNELGYKVLDPHIGAIYGDSITLERARLICEGLERKGFASTNIVFGIGSYTFSLKSRDSLSWAIKATHSVINGEERFLLKDPKTDDGTKKSLTGLMAVIEQDGKLVVVDGLTRDQYERDYKHLDKMEDVFVDGEVKRLHTLQEIRDRIATQ